jgi:hypothetical protein
LCGLGNSLITVRFEQLAHVILYVDFSQSQRNTRPFR